MRRGRRRDLVTEKSALQVDADGSCYIDVDCKITDLGEPRQGWPFRLDFWSEEFNNVNDPSLLPPPTGFSKYVTFPDIAVSTTWGR